MNKESEPIPLVSQLAAVRSTMDRLPLLFGYFDRQGRCCFANQRLATSVGLSAKELAGRTLGELFAPQALALVRPAFERALAGETAHCEAMYGRPPRPCRFEFAADPSARTASLEGCTLVGEELNRTTLEPSPLSTRHLECLDQLSRVIAQAHDTPELIRATLQTVLDMFQCDRAWLIFPCDTSAPVWKVVFEATRPEYPGALEMNVDFPIDAEGAQVVAEALATSEPVAYGIGRTCPWSGSKQFDIQAQLNIALRPKLGLPWLLGLHQCSYPRDWTARECHLFRDIGLRLTDALTSLLHTDALRESEANFRAIAENAHLGIVIVGPQETLLYANQEAYTLLDGSLAEQSLRSVRELVGKPMTGTQEVVLPRLEGPPLPLELTGTATSWQGRPAQLLLLRDIGERNRLDAQRAALLERELLARGEAEQASRAKDEFLAIVSHELRTPLTTIVMWAHMLRQGKLDEAGTKKAIETIARAASAQERLVDDLLDMTRSIAGKLLLDVQRLDPLPTVLSAVESLRPLATKKSIELMLHVEITSLQILSEPLRLQQVVVNLLGNAIKFTPAGGRVQVRLSAEEGGFRIRVSDNGQGIRPEFLRRIFDPFAQADGSTTRAHGGLGLGLAITRSIVDLHEGRLTAHSDGEGMGAVFTVDLPLHSVKHAPQAIPESAAPATSTVR